MAPLPRSGLFGFLLLLGALLPSQGLAASSPTAPANPSSIEARLQRISAALHQQTIPPGADSEPGADSTATNVEQAGVDGSAGADRDKLAWTFVNAPAVGFRNGGFRNGGFRNGGFYNGGFRNGGFYNGGFRNGGFGNGGGWRNGGFLNRW
jgi:rSAM-associated Gly-rich repeat protein